MINANITKAANDLVREVSRVDGIERKENKRAWLKRMDGAMCDFGYCALAIGYGILVELFSNIN